MKKTSIIPALVFLFCISFSVKAQDDVELFVDDMLKVADDFASPAAEGATYQFGAGWFTSASSLDLWQINFAIHGNALFIPEGKRTVSIASDNYNTFDIRGASSSEIPTAFGGKTDIVFEGEIAFLNQSKPFDFNAIDGLDKKTIAHPLVQVSIGLPLNTDLSVRFLPETTIDGVRVGTYAFGAKHNINQYFSNPQPTDFQFAALIAYSSFDVLYEFEPINLEDIVTMDEIEVDGNLWLFELISSKTFRDSSWELLAAVGMTNSTFNYTMGGSGLALIPINDALGTLENNEIEFKGDLGINYHLSNFIISSAISFGSFYNLNLGLHYRL